MSGVSMDVDDAATSDTSTLSTVTAPSGDDAASSNISAAPTSPLPSGKKFIAILL